MLSRDEIRTRLKLLAQSKSISKKWKKVNDELITSAFPCLETRERELLGCIIQTIWDIPFSNAMYSEVIYRLRRFNKKLFASKEIIDKSISDLCASGILNKHESEFRRYNKDGTYVRKISTVIEVPEEFRREALNAMAEVFKTTLDSYLQPERKQQF